MPQISNNNNNNISRMSLLNFNSNAINGIGKLANGNLNNNNHHHVFLNYQNLDYMNKNNSNINFNHHNYLAQNPNFSSMNHNINYHNNQSATLTPGRKSASPQFFRSNYLNDYCNVNNNGQQFNNSFILNNHHSSLHTHSNGFASSLNSSSSYNNTSFIAHNHDNENNSLKIPTTPTRSKSLSPSLRCVTQPARLRHKQDRLNNINNNSSVSNDSHKSLKQKQDENNNIFVKPFDININSKNSNNLKDNPHYFEPIINQAAAIKTSNKANSNFNMKNVIDKNESKNDEIKKPLPVSAKTKNNIDAKINKLPDKNANNLKINEKNIKDDIIKFKLPLNVRKINLNNYPSNQAPNSKRNYSVAMQKIKSAFTPNSNKSINILKRNIQFILNERINKILNEFTNEFIHPAFTHINSNCGKDSISNQEISYLIASLLDESKMLYLNEIDPTRLNKDEISPSLSSSTDSTSSSNSKRSLNTNINDFDEYEAIVAKKRLKEDPDMKKLKQLTSETKFVCGKLVNDIYKKHLQLNQPTSNDEQSGLNNNNNNKSIYSSFPHLFRYEADQDDRQWLNENSIIKKKNLKCFIFLLDDVDYLFSSINIYQSGILINNSNDSEKFLDLDKFDKESIFNKLKNASFILPDSILYKLNKKYLKMRK